MTDRFTDMVVHRSHRFSLGRDNRAGGYFLSTPISGFNRAVEYEAYFRITTDEFERFREAPESAEAFLEACRNHRNGDRQIT